MQHAPDVLVQYAQATCGLDADKVSCMHTHLYIPVCHSHTCTHSPEHIHSCIHALQTAMHVHMYVCMYVCMRVCVMYMGVHANALFST